MENKRDLVAHIATQLVTAQINAGSKHPSPGLITEAVDTAQALVDALEDHFDARELAIHQAALAAERAREDAEAKAALDAKVAAEQAAALAKAVDAAKNTPPGGP